MKQTKIKLLCLLLAALMLLSSLTACGKDKAKDSNLIKLGDYELLYKGACIMEDSDGNDAIVLTLDFTNLSLIHIFTFGGEPPKDQRVYYFNTKELIGNKYGTPSPVPFRVVDQRAGIDIDIAIRCFGEYSYRICDPILFYTNVCGNVGEDYTRDRLDGQLKTELLTALQPAFAKISDMGIRYSALPGHTMELADALNEVLSGKWRNLRGLEIVSFGVSSVKASEEDEQMLKEMQRNAAFMDPTRAAAHLVGAQAAAMQSAASNQGAGPAMAFMGMNMAGQMGGMNAQNLYQTVSYTHLGMDSQ